MDSNIESLITLLRQGQSPRVGLDTELRRAGLESASHQDLLRLREYAPAQTQGLLSPYEHRAFARELVQENPLSALSLLGAIPAYQLYKLTGMSGARSSPSWDQILQGYLGLGEGLLRR